MVDLYECEAPITSLGIEVPAWIDPEITPNQVAAILEGGCESGAYMPAVTYSDALDTMREHGDDILDYIQDALGEIPLPQEPISWGGMACQYLSTAVELWASSVEGELQHALAEEV